MKIATRYEIDKTLILQPDSSWCFLASWFYKSIFSVPVIPSTANYLSPAQVNEKIEKAIVCGGEIRGEKGTVLNQCPIGTLLRTLQHNRDSWELQAAILKELGEDRRASDVKEFDYSNRDACEGLLLSILLPMHYFNIYDVLFSGCKALGNVIRSTSPAMFQRPQPFFLSSSLIALGAIPAMIFAAISDKPEEEISLNLLTALNIVAQETIMEGYFSQDYVRLHGSTPRALISGFRGVEIIVNIRDINKKREHVVLLCCQVLQKLNWDSERNQARMKPSTIVPCTSVAIVSTIIHNNHPDIIEASCLLLDVILKQAETSQFIREVDFDMLFWAIKTHIDDGPALGRFFGVANFFLLDYDDQEDDVRISPEQTSLLLHHVVHGIQKHPREPLVQGAGFDIIKSFFSSASCLQENREMIDLVYEESCRSCLIAGKVMTNELEVLERACNLLVTLLSMNVSMMCGGSAGGAREFFSMLVNTLAQSGISPQLQQRIVDLLETFVEFSTKESQATLLSLRTVDSVLVAMKQNRHDRQLQQKSCKIVHALINPRQYVCSPDGYSIMEDLDVPLAVSVLTNCVGDYHRDKDIIGCASNVVFFLKKKLDEALSKEETAKMCGLD